MYLTFARPVYLWFLLTVPILVVIHFITLGHIRRRALKFANFEAIARITGGGEGYRPTKGAVSNKNLALLFIRLVVLISLIFAISDTNLWYTGASSDSDFVIALDASASMLADDIAPNRLEASKEAGIFFIDSLESRAHVGVVSFAGISVVEQKPTIELDFARKAIENIGVSSTGGTDLGNAIVTASNLFFGERDKSIILLTDGQSNVGAGPERGLDYAVKNGITIYTIGVGTEEGGSFLGLQLKSRLDEETLKFIAFNSGGEYFKAESKEKLFEAYNKIATSDDRKLSLNMTWPLITIALILLFMEWIFINTRYTAIG